MTFKAFRVYRVLIGMGLVDYCGEVYATSRAEAEDIARLRYPWFPGMEHLDIEEAA